MRKTTNDWKHARPLIRLLLPTAWLLLSISCKDPDRPKPDEKFYCKVDGKAWRPDNDGDFKVTSLSADLTEKSKYLAIIALDAKTDETIILIIVDTNGIDTTSAGNTYELSVNRVFPNDPPAANLLRPLSEGSTKHTRYSTSKNLKGQFRLISVTKDKRLPNYYTVKAEFEFTAASPSGNVIRITDGRFNSLVQIFP